MSTLKQLRENSFLTQEELALACGVSRHAVWKWEHAIAKPSLPLRRKLVEIYGISVLELSQAIEETRKEYEKDRTAA
jgi:transcriptional regulator with XRE-family HTH domain